MECLTRLAEEIEARRAAVLATLIASPAGFPLPMGHKFLVGPGGLLAGTGPVPGLEAAVAAAAQEALAEGRPGTRNLEVDGKRIRVYLEPYLPLPVLVIAGGGHVARALAAMAAMAGFAVTVLDDRPGYASVERFPDAARVLCAPFAESLARLELGPEHYVVLVTRGHRHDLYCLRQVIERPLAYIGMIGSRNRVETVFRLLREEDGIDPAHIARVHAPIGLDIGAYTAGEIAVAILAELIRVRRGGTGRSLSEMNRASVHGSRGGQAAAAKKSNSPCPM